MGATATLTHLSGTSFTHKRWEFETRWPASSFHDDPRMPGTDDGWLDYLGAMTADELRAFRDEHRLQGRDPRLDHILNGGWTGKVLIQCLEWEGCN
jgi:hypothetical protein